MRALIAIAALLAAFLTTSAGAQSPPGHYTTADTEIGALLDDPAARAILDAHIPGFSANTQIDMARSMTLKLVQQFAPDTVTDQVLADIDAELAKLPAKTLPAKN
jgi:para-nitrobenzyl esterase